ncbi:DUF2779 domain-containing protein [Candidatus Woesearchaeota archaeon]|nr:DUF2779 domain-containing protein [Candidatus Woesearchaeota archaeon]
MKLLTKSKYLIGLQCPKYLWIVFNDSKQIPKAGVPDEFKFKEGEKVGELAKKLFPDGIDLPADDFVKNLEESEKALKERKPLFEAGFKFGNIFSRADVIVPVGDEWDIVEVKSATKVKDINYHDVAFQKYVYESKGLKIRKCFLLHLNSKYIRKGELDLKGLFVKEDITSKVSLHFLGIKGRIDSMFKIISSEKMPEMKVGAHCSDPYKCPVCHCWEELPENHVFCLYRGGKLSCKLFEEGIEAIGDIPEDVKLNDKQGIQRDCALSGKPHIHKESIKHFLNTLKYPLYYLDFETFSTAIPMFDGLKTYSQVPFQFSLHVVEKEGSKPKHYEFLYNGNEDPREDFILALKKVLGDKGSVVVYNQVFEINRLKDLGEHFPKYKKWVDSVLSRIVDLLVPFRNFSYYNPKQEGSASIKKVLPALCSKSYKGMGITDGGTASVKFFNMAYGECENKDKIRQDLLKYCELDTLAEVWIVEELGKLI